jgi:hypothetical protein
MSRRRFLGGVAAGVGTAAMAASGVVHASTPPPNVVANSSGGYDVTPTNSAADISNVQWAFHNVHTDGTILLKAENGGQPTPFNFDGPPGPLLGVINDSPNLSENANVTITGEVFNGHKTTIKDGFNCFNIGYRGWGPPIDFTFFPPPHKSDFFKLNVVISDIVFDNFEENAILVLKCDNLTIEGCEFFGGKPAADPSIPHPVGFPISIGPPLDPYLPPFLYYDTPEDIDGLVLIQNNYIDGNFDVKQESDPNYVQIGNLYYFGSNFGAFISYMAGRVEILSNVIENCDVPIELITVAGPNIIQDNQLETAKKGRRLEGLNVWDCSDTTISHNTITTHAFNIWEWDESQEPATMRGTGIDIGYAFGLINPNYPVNNLVQSNTIVLNPDEITGTGLIPFAGMIVNADDSIFKSNNISGVCESAFYLGDIDLPFYYFISTSSGNSFLGNYTSGATASVAQVYIGSSAHGNYFIPLENDPGKDPNDPRWDATHDPPFDPDEGINPDPILGPLPNSFGELTHPPKQNSARIIIEGYDNHFEENHYVGDVKPWEEGHGIWLMKPFSYGNTVCGSFIENPKPGRTILHYWKDQSEQNNISEVC